MSGCQRSRIEAAVTESSTAAAQQAGGLAIAIPSHPTASRPGGYIPHEEGAHKQVCRRSEHHGGSQRPPVKRVWSGRNCLRSYRHPPHLNGLAGQRDGGCPPRIVETWICNERHWWWRYRVLCHQPRAKPMRYERGTEWWGAVAPQGAEAEESGRGIGG